MSDATLLGGRYRLLDPLGRGGMGTVYVAIQEGLGRKVAIKLLDQRLAEDHIQLERFKREAELVASLGHPNIVQVTDFQYAEQPGGQPFLVMELLHGESLGARLAREQALPGARVAFIAAQVLSALGAAHRAGIVHRDIKPDNIFLLSDAAIPDTVKVLDFGIAKLGSIAGGAAAKLTSTGAMLGTPAFMAPEQARGAEDVDARADIYAVGATMYQALSGRMPHDASSIPALLFAIVEKTPVPLHEIRPDLPSDLVAVVERAMAKNRDDRFADTSAMRAALGPWSGLPASIPPPVSATAATIASSQPLAHQPTTPIVLHRTPPPTPVVPYAPPALPPTAPDARKRRNRTLVALAVVAAVAFKFVHFGGDDGEEKRRAHPTPESSAAEQLGLSVARSVTSAVLGQTLPIPPPLTTAAVSAVASVEPTVTASAAPVVRHKYSGDHSTSGGSDFGNCRGCDWEAYRQGMSAKGPAIATCLEASIHDPPLHESMDYEVSVDATGALTSFTLVETTVPPRLDQCMRAVMRSVPLNTRGRAGSFKYSFSAECPKWAPPDKLKWCAE